MVAPVASLCNNKIPDTFLQARWPLEIPPLYPQSPLRSVISLSLLDVSLESLVFFCAARNSLVSFLAFPFSSRDFRGLVGIDNPCVLVGFP